MVELTSPGRQSRMETLSETGVVAAERGTQMVFPRVRDAMRVEGLSCAELVTGAAGLDGRIRGFAMVAEPKGLAAVSPGSLLLLDLAPATQAAEAAAWVGQIGASAVCAMVVRAPLGEATMATLRDCADERGIPLFLLPAATDWLDLITPIQRLLVDVQYRRLTEAMDAHQRLLKLVLDGQGVEEICRAVASLLDTAVTIQDPSFRPLALSTVQGGEATGRRRPASQIGARAVFDPRIREMVERLRRQPGPSLLKGFPPFSLDDDVVVAPVVAAERVLGYVCALAPRRLDEDRALLIVEQAAIVAAVAMVKEREVSEIEVRVRGEYLDELIDGSYGDEKAARRRARYFGYPTLGEHVLLMTDVDDFRGFMDRHHLDESTVQDIKHEYLTRVSSQVRSQYRDALVQLRSDSVLALMPVERRGRDAVAPMREVARRVTRGIEEWGIGFTVSVAISGPVSLPAEVKAAYREARMSLEASARFQRRGQILLAEAGLVGILAEASDERLRAFANRHLGPLISHDVGHGASLVTTLHVYLEEPTQELASRRLGIHPNTLRYRLDRIQDLAGVLLSDPEARLNMMVAIQIMALLGM